MKKKYRGLMGTTVFFAALALVHCSQLAEVINTLTNADCDSYILSEISSDLSEQCRELSDYLEEESDSLASLAQALPVADLAGAGAAFFQLTDESGDPIEGITDENVAVSYSADGQTFTDIEGATVTPLKDVETTQVSILLNIDYSGSVSDGDLEDVVSGLSLFLNTLEAGYRGAVVKFSSEVTLVQGFTEDAVALDEAVSDTSFERSLTSLNDAIYDGVTALAGETTALRLMVLFTDGVDNDSTRTLDEAIALAQDNNIPVCVIGVTFADTDTLERIASDTGCFYIYKQLFTSLDDSFEAFADQIDNFQMVDLPDSFAETAGTLKIGVETGTAEVTEFTQVF